MAKKHKDWLGNEIKVGSRIVIPQRSGKVLYTVTATVKEIVPRALDVWDEHRLSEHRIETPSFTLKVEDVRWPQVPPAAVTPFETIRAAHGVVVIG